MFQIVTMWNLSRPDQEMSDSISSISLRGYKSDALLTGEFATKLARRAIRPLSVGNIADRHCAVGRDVYFTKGLSRPRRRNRSSQDTWGQKAGMVIEKYIESVFEQQNARNSRTYERLIKTGDRVYKSFVSKNGTSIDKLKFLENESVGISTGDTDWLLRLLSNNGRAELSLKLLHSQVKRQGDIGFNKLYMKSTIEPTPEQIGISSPSMPDFIIPEHRIVGDIKTGIEFERFYQLTCAGYALAYENQFGESNNIDWGVIYFFPSRSPTAYVKPITFAQIYFFPIDDNLRRWFMNIRDETYNIISKPEPPSLPTENQRKHCHYCRYRQQCITDGLTLDV